MKPLSTRIQNIKPSGIRKYFDVKRDDLISLGVGTIDFDPFPAVQDAAIQAIEENFTGYTTNSGILPLREAIIGKLAKENSLSYSVEDILVTCGSSEAIAAVTQVVLDPGDEAIMFGPAYSAFGPLVELCNATPIEIPTRGEDNWNPDVSAVEAAITPRTKLLFMNSPGNPTGAALSREVTEALSELAIKYDLWVVSDELYERIMFDGKQIISPASLPGMHERTFTVNGFSKGFGMTGWRVGYVASPKGLTSALVKAQQFSSICAPAISQRAALAALTSSSEHFKAMLDELTHRRQFIVNQINQMPYVHCQPQDGTFYTFVDAREFLREKGEAMRSYLRQHTDGPLSDSEVEQLTDFVLIRGNVALTAGSAFGPCGEGWFRVSGASNMNVLQKGLTRVREALEAL
ncbi:MAG: pyridoxal phosphate-dependent aminotransferase [Anaerolineae bacterium]|nr:pyridoxal phosphate-dependent aminotransferase [Anaerolineae bacterium]MBN8617639.1 pyridoxal phosphate-dependent aminotransferase [Anaerolineae bacterium]